MRAGGQAFEVLAVLDVARVQEPGHLHLVDEVADVDVHALGLGGEVVVGLSPQPANTRAATQDGEGQKTGITGAGPYNPPTVARAPRSMSSSRIDCIRLKALPSLRLFQPRRTVTASMNLSVGSADSDSVVTSTRVALPAGVSVHVVHVLLRLNFPPRPAATILCGALDLDERHVAPREAVQRRVELEARAGAAAVGIDPGQPPLLQVVVGELGMVGDVREVLEDLLARTGRSTTCAVTGSIDRAEY